MSFDIQLFRKDKSVIKKKELEQVLFEQHWIMRLPEDNSYALMHSDDHSYIEITHRFKEVDTAFLKSKTVDIVELRTWANSSEWTSNHLIRLIDTLANRLELEIYDLQQGKIIKPSDYDSIEGFYIDWRQRVEAFSLELENLDKENLLPITAFIGHSFLPEDDFITSYIVSAIRNRIKRVVTGRPAQIRSVSEKVKEKIDSADLAIQIFTRKEKKKNGTWITSDWVLNEAIYAHGKGKKLIIIKESEVEDLPGIFGDMEYVPLDRKNIVKAVKNVEEMLDDFCKKKKM